MEYNFWYNFISQYLFVVNLLCNSPVCLFACQHLSEQLLWSTTQSILGYCAWDKRIHSELWAVRKCISNKWCVGRFVWNDFLRCELRLKDWVRSSEIFSYTFDGSFVSSTVPDHVILTSHFTYVYLTLRDVIDSCTLKREGDLYGWWAEKGSLTAVKKEKKKKYFVVYFTIPRVSKPRCVNMALCNFLYGLFALWEREPIVFQVICVLKIKTHLWRAWRRWQVLSVVLWSCGVDLLLENCVLCVQNSAFQICTRGSQVCFYVINSVELYSCSVSIPFAGKYINY